MDCVDPTDLGDGISSVHMYFVGVLIKWCVDYFALTVVYTGNALECVYYRWDMSCLIGVTA
jgi:hypothetical protein